MRGRARAQYIVARFLYSARTGGRTPDKNPKINDLVKKLFGHIGKCSYLCNR